MINIKLCEMVQSTELHLFIPLSMTLTIFQGHSSVKQFQLKILRCEPIKLKLCMVIYHVDYIKYHFFFFLILAPVQGRLKKNFNVGFFEHCLSEIFQTEHD